MLFFRLIARIPFFIMYRISDLIFMVIYHLIRYRREIVLENLRLSFPEKEEKELKRISRKYYRHMCDIMVEAFKGLSMNEKKVRKRVRFVNPELLEKYAQNNQPIVLMTSHQGNWEWLGYILNTYTSFQVDGIYQKIDNSFVNKLMYKIRSHMGTYLMESREVFKDIKRREHIKRLIIFIADQGPRDIEKGYKTTFLNQDTTFFIGGERIAMKYKMPVVFLNIKRVKRGYFEVQANEIDAPPFQETPHFITDQYARLTENYIRETPSQWLWSHRRWKYNRRAAEERHLQEAVQ